MNKFSCISDITIDDISSWQDKIFLTFDIDWAEDFVVEPLIKLLEDNNIKATWFITHQTKLLNRLRQNPNFEIGIHPNFNNLLNGNHENGKNSKEVLSRLLEIVPDAKSVRSHSMCQSSYLMNEFASCGLKYDCNHFIPFRSTIDCKPWLHYNGSIVKVPYFWEDDIEATLANKFDLTIPRSSKGIKVFDFHPIHTYLNTEDMDRYERSRLSHRDSDQLYKFINNGNIGSLTALKELIEI